MTDPAEGEKGPRNQQDLVGEDIDEHTKVIASDDADFELFGPEGGDEVEVNIEGAESHRAKPRTQVRRKTVIRIQACC